jgi:amidase
MKLSDEGKEQQLNMMGNRCKRGIIILLLLTAVKGFSQTGVIKISKEHHINNMSADNKPCAVVRNGSRLLFECWDALGGKSKYYFENNISWSDKRRYGTDNPLTGPVFIEGAEPGDVLEVEIHDIRLGRYGYMQNMEKNKFVEGAERELVYLEVEIIGDEMLYEGKRMPVYPMVGGIGTAGFKEMTTGEVWENGGNIDSRLIKVGSKVLLPVFVEGALLAMGDVHAAMGDGEVFGKGVEIAADIEVTVRIRKDLSLQRPMVLNPDMIATIATDPDVLKAKDLAVMEMGRFLVNHYGFSSIDASALIGFYGNLRIGQIVNPQKTIKMEIEKKYIELFNGSDAP